MLQALALSFGLVVSQASGAAGDSLIADVEVVAYELDVRFEPADGSLAGTALVLIDPDSIQTDELSFYLHGELRVDGVAIDGRPVMAESERVFYDSDYSLIATRVRFPVAGLDVGNGITVVYSGHFHPSRARSPSDYMRIDEDGVHLRSFGYSLWFPTFREASANSHPVSFLHVRLDTPAEYVSVFTGTFLEESLEGGRRIREWEAECELFEAQCTARRFDVAEVGDVFVYSLKDPESREQVPAIADFVEGFTAICEEAYGEPAGRQTHVVQMTAFGDIASGNTIGISEASWRAFSTSSWARRTLAHELVHAYVFVPVQQDDPLYALVIEGFPSYFHLPVLDALRDDEFLANEMKRTEQAYLTRRKSGGPLPELPLTQIASEDIGSYKDTFVLNDRALLFCDYLRRHMGPEAFGEFVLQLFGLERLGRTSFAALVEEYLPDSGDDVALWLDTTEFPDRFRR